MDLSSRLRAARRAHGPEEGELGTCSWCEETAIVVTIEWSLYNRENVCRKCREAFVEECWEDSVEAYS